MAPLISCYRLVVRSTLVLKARVDPLLMSFVTYAILRFTSGAKPANFLVASNAAKPFWSTYFFKYWWDSNLFQYVWQTGALKPCSNWMPAFAFPSNLKEWVLWQQMVVFILKVYIWWQRSKKNANADVKCLQSLTARDMGCMFIYKRELHKGWQVVL